MKKYLPVIILGVLFLIVFLVIWSTSTFYNNSTITPRHERANMATSLISLDEQFQQTGILQNVPDYLPINIENNTIVIQATANGDVYALLADLEALGLQDAAVYGESVSGYLPITALSELDTLPSLRYAAPSPYISHAGSVQSQGDNAMQSDTARSVYGVDGSGVTVGVLSDSYNRLGGAASGITSGDLPSNILILDEGDAGDRDEGRAMLEIIHDIAPGAALQFHTANGGEAAFATGIQDLANAGSDVIVDDIGYLYEAYFQDDLISQSVDDVVLNDGVAYFSATGNSGTQSYEAPFRDSGIIENIQGANYLLHDFNPGAGVDVRQAITLPYGGRVLLILQWDDAHASIGAQGAATDLDIYLEDSNGNILDFSWNDNLFTGDPVEGLFAYTNLSGASQTLNLVIGKYLDGAALANPTLIKYIYFGDESIQEYNTHSSTSWGHPNAAHGAGVAAAWFNQTPYYGINPPLVEDFSALGGMPIYFDVTGTRLAQAEIRNQPRFTAPDGANTTFFGNDTGADPDSYPNFFGTSAAAPHAAGVAALMLDCDPRLSPVQIYTTLADTAIDITTTPASTNYDYFSGTGLIQADLALAAISNRDVSVLGNGVPIADGDTTPELTDWTHFGDIPYDNGSQTYRFTITNTSDNCGYINLTGAPLVSLSGDTDDFTIVSQATLTQLAPDDSTSFEIVFDPTSAGDKSTIVSIQTDDPDVAEQHYTFEIRGKGTDSVTVPDYVHTLIAPTNTISTAYPIFQWAPEDHATWYYLWTNTPFGQYAEWVEGASYCTASLCEYSYQTALGDGDYQWAILASNAYGDAAWSMIETFTLSGGVIHTATILSPDDSTDPNPTFSWTAEAGATWYYLWISGPFGYVDATWYEQSQICADGICSITPTLDLLPGEYRFWVQHWGPTYLYSPWTAEHNFTMTATPLPSILLSPQGMTSDSSPTFSWQTTPGASWHYLWISNREGTVTLGAWYSGQAGWGGVCAANGICAATPNLDLENGEYLWWIQGWGPGISYAPWSNMGVFQVSN